MLCASSGYSASADFAAFRDELAKCRDVLIVDVSDLFTTKRTWLLLELLECCS